MPLRMTCNLMRLEQHLDQCMVASFGYSIQLGLEAVLVAIPRAICTSGKKLKKWSGMAKNGKEMKKKWSIPKYAF